MQLFFQADKETAGQAHLSCRFFKPAFFLLVVFSLFSSTLQAQWIQTGKDIDGEAANDNSGGAVSLSSDGSTIAIGAIYNSNPNGSGSGHARGYKLVSGVWTKQGNDIDGEAQGDNSGVSVSLASNGSIVATGAIGNDGNRSPRLSVFEGVSSTPSGPSAMTATATKPATSRCTN